jgi:hypothetical protein
LKNLKNLKKYEKKNYNIKNYNIKFGKKKYFYIKIIFSGCVIGTPVNFSRMTGRALAVNLKLIF